VVFLPPARIMKAPADDVAEHPPAPVAQP
jgi:hypothetical protein